MKRIVLTLLGVFCVAGAMAQGINNVRINEVLVVNENNYEDDYGHRPAWIEIFNSGYEAVNVSSCYIGVTRPGAKEILYKIPKDPATLMHSQTYLVFFCEGTDTKGTFYTNFTLDGVSKITFYSADGKTAIDEFRMDPGAQQPDVSVGWMKPDGVDEAVIMSLPKTTPNATNETIAAVSKDELFRQRDRSGGVMSIIAMMVVFSALTLIFFILKGFGMFMVWFHSRREQKIAAGEAVVTKRKPASSQVEEEMAAIGLALKMFQEEQHVLETTVITINRASRVYSPWSSKIHGITPVPTKK